MFQSRLHRRLHFPYYVMAPDYRETSSGVQCLHYLCHALNLEGAEAYLTGTSVVNPALKTPLLTNEILARHADSGTPAIAIYPEVLEGAPLATAVTVRYMLNREGVIRGNKVNASDDDIFVYHRPEFVDPAHPGRVMTLPMIDPERFKPDDDVERTLDLLYLNRIPESEIDLSRFPEAIRILSPQDPLPLDELADTLRRARVMYTFESSTTCRLAILCGCPVVSMVAPGYEQLACTPQTAIDVGGGFAWDDAPGSIERARGECGHVRELQASREEQFWQQLQEFITETQQAAASKRAAPRRDDLPRWLETRQPPPALARILAETLAQENSPTLGVVVVGSDPADSDRTLHSLARARDVYPALKVWHVSPEGTPAAPRPMDGSLVLEPVPADAGQGVASVVNAIAAVGASDWIMVVDAGCEFLAPALQQVAVNMVADPQLRAVCADEMQRTPKGELSALFRPDFNLDLLLSMPGSLSRHWLFRREVLLGAGGLDGSLGEAAELGLLLRLIETGGIDGLGHVHEPLLITPPQALQSTQVEVEALQQHLRNRGYTEATVESHRPGCYRIGYGHPATPGVSIIIPTRNQLALLQRCVESLLEKTAYKNYELLIVDNGSTDEDACRWLDGIEALGSMQLRVLRHPGEFDYPAMVNMAASHARGDYLLLLDNDTAIVREDWLDALLNHAQRPEVGIVGAKLLRANGTVEHAGYLLGVQGAVGTPFAGAKLDAPGYMQRLQVDQDYTAVSGSCLMVRRSVFEELGGLTTAPALRYACNDVDFCLRVRTAGYLVVWTPHALVMHEGGASIAALDGAGVSERVAEAHAAIYEGWMPLVANDPAYNGHLSLSSSAFRVETKSWMNRAALPWRPLPTVLALNADLHGCGYYRVIHPSRAMVSAGVADARIADHYVNPPELERIAPDAILFQRQMLKDQIDAQKRMTRFRRVFKVAELDDYLANVPLKSAHRNQLPRDILKHMRAALKTVDRLVVSTEPLAEALKGLHPDIRVSKNRLPPDWWANLRGQRRQGRRPRVGWGGGSSHRGDLELVADVVRALSDEVEWVFMGMCPEKLRPFIHEFHQGVPITEYPARLAALDLDLAIAPLEDNQFNRCKSNLRLLEFGACGFPVVCSDVIAFQDGLPVTRVKPRFKDWVDAIRMHVNDLDAAARAGDALREAIHRDWMLDEASAREWLASWMPD